MEDCLFCKMAKGSVPVHKVYEDDQIIVVNDINPQAPVHQLIIPRKHLVNSLDLLPEHDHLVGRVHRVAALLARDGGFAENGFRIVNNNNAGAGQSVWHMHFHLLAGFSQQDMTAGSL